MLVVAWVVYKNRSSIKLYRDGQGSPKFHYSARGSLTTWELRKKFEKMCGKSKLQEPEKKTACVKRKFQETANVFAALAYQKLGCSLKKFLLNPARVRDSRSDT